MCTWVGADARAGLDRVAGAPPEPFLPFQWYPLGLGLVLLLGARLGGGPELRGNSLFPRRCRLKASVELREESITSSANPDAGALATLRSRSLPLAHRPKNAVAPYLRSPSLRSRIALKTY